MTFIPGAERDQPVLLPATVQDTIPAECAVRVIDAFVASLGLHKLGFRRARPAATGRPGFASAEMQRLYIYGYLNGLRSSRRPERACRINLGIIRLPRQLTPDCKTIADFRRDNPMGITATRRAFVPFCRKANLFAAQVAQVAIDGANPRAAASRKRVMNQNEVASETVALGRRIGDCLLAADVAETDDTSDQRTRTALREKARRTDLIELAARGAVPMTGGRSPRREGDARDGGPASVALGTGSVARTDGRCGADGRSPGHWA